MDANIRVNNTREVELDFDVNIQGISVEKPENAAQVRFVITNVHNGDMSFKCERRADSVIKWFVKLPPMPMLSKTSNAHTFRVEVIIDGYYFEPAQGNLIVLQDPDVSISQSSKPKVSATITPKEEPKKEETKKEGPKEEPKKKDVGETTAGGGTQIDQQPAPTAVLLAPEFPSGNDPEGDERSHMGNYEVPQDANTDEHKLWHNTHQEPVEEPVEEDPADVAEQIIHNTLGIIPKKPEKPGFLFTRIGDKPVIEGIEPSEAVKRKMRNKADAVKAALGLKK